MVNVVLCRKQLMCVHCLLCRFRHMLHKYNSLLERGKALIYRFYARRNVIQVDCLHAVILSCLRRVSSSIGYSIRDIELTPASQRLLRSFY